MKRVSKGAVKPPPKLKGHAQRLTVAEARAGEWLFRLAYDRLDGEGILSLRARIADGPPAKK